MEQKWVAEYNFGQKTFHINPVEQSIKSNKRIIDKYLSSPSLDVCWIPFSYGSYEECAAAIKKLENNLGILNKP